MFVVCLKSKYGFCKHGRTCDKIHFTDICENVRGCSGYQCDKRHPMACYYFENYKRCKFNSFCSYRHDINIIDVEEDNLKKEVENLKKEVTHLKIKVTCMAKKLDAFEKHTVNENSIRSESFEMPNIVINPVNEIAQNIEAETLDNSDLEIVDKVDESVLVSSDKIDMSLGDLIRNLSGIHCDKCEFIGKSKRGLKIHIAKAHSEVKTYCRGTDQEKDKWKCKLCENNKKLLNFVAGCYKTKSDFDKHIKEVHESEESEAAFEALFSNKDYVPKPLFF